MIRIGRESQCLPYAGFFYNKTCANNNRTVLQRWEGNLQKCTGHTLSPPSVCHTINLSKYNIRGAGRTDERWTGCLDESHCWGNQRLMWRWTPQSSPTNGGVTPHPQIGSIPPLCPSISSPPQKELYSNHESSSVSNIWCNSFITNHGIISTTI